jgi:hypothetical protein
MLNSSSWASTLTASAPLLDPYRTLTGSVSYVSCVSWMYWVNAAETHETLRWESGMRYPRSYHNI